MDITSARYAAEDNSLVEVAATDHRGRDVSIVVRVDPDDRYYKLLLASGVDIAAYTTVPPTPGEVRAEASRRMCAMIGARDDAHLGIIISNGMREAVELLRVKVDRPWTAAEEQRDAQLRGFSKSIDAIRTASNALEAADTIPSDYADDKYWPVIGG